MQQISTDVLVIGSGLSGLSACITARRANKSATILSTQAICSGSSFSHKTWGLGFVTPGKLGPEDLARTIEQTGGHINNPELTRTLVDHAEDAAAFLESFGPTLERPHNPNQKEFIPCFDTHIRSWHGYRPHAFAAPLRAELQALKDAGQKSNEELSHTHVLSLLKDQTGRVSGAFALDKNAEPLLILAGSVIIASGGYAALWQHHLCANECRGTMHTLALDAGARCTNLEFVQLMFEASAHEAKAVHNEKAFSWTHIIDATTGASIFDELGIPAQKAEQALNIHAGHGPFTARLDSRLVETSVALFKKRYPQRHVVATLDHQLLTQGEKPEFIEAYLNWLQSALSVSANTPLTLHECAHSCNGGIQIDTSGRTRVPGLYASGEAAGGVHGADRIGGLASVTATVFGRIAGETAAAEASPSDTDEAALELASPIVIPSASGISRPHAAQSYEARAQELGDVLDEFCLVLRNDAGLALAEQRIHNMCDETVAQSHIFSSLSDTLQALDRGDKGFNLRLLAANELYSSLRLARSVVHAMRERTESRGSHMREDFPETDPAWAHASLSWFEES
ncbi:MAG: FAD-binding protein [Atopobiaceae bacterium]